MWRASLRDLQWRRRRFLIAVAATGLVFSMTLLMSGASTSLHAQDRRIIDSFDGDAWLVAKGASGPFTTTTPVAAKAAAEAKQMPGVTDASPVILARTTVKGNSRKDVNLIGLPPGGMGQPKVDEGRAVRADGEVVLDSSLASDVGDKVNVSGQAMRVVGVADDIAYYFGTPTAYVTLADAQRQLLGGQPLANAIVVQGTPGGNAPAGLKVMSPAEARTDLARPTKSGDQTIQFINILLWIVAAGIIGSIVYLSALERTHDFAVMKATGVANRSLLTGLALQAVILSAAAAVIAAVLALLLAPGFPFSVTISGSTYVLLVVVAIVIGLLASLAGLRRAVHTDPALAFGGA